jgi:hypothetical protein
LLDPDRPYRQIDVFLEEPLPFVTLQTGSIVGQGEGYAVRVASCEHLLAMKRKIPHPRPQDLLDIESLEQRVGETKS